jgi:hypothetical protein
MHTTINIGHWADSDNMKMSTFNKTYSGLIWRCFEMPNAQYLNRCLILKMTASSLFSFLITKKYRNVIHTKDET